MTHHNPEERLSAVDVLQILHTILYNINARSEDLYEETLQPKHQITEEIISSFELLPPIAQASAQADVTEMEMDTVPENIRKEMLHSISETERQIHIPNVATASFVSSNAIVQSGTQVEDINPWIQNIKSLQPMGFSATVCKITLVVYFEYFKIKSQIVILY